MKRYFLQSRCKDEIGWENVENEEYDDFGTACTRAGVLVESWWSKRGRSIRVVDMVDRRYPGLGPDDRPVVAEIGPPGSFRSKGEGRTKMSVKLVKEVEDGTICLDDLKDGQMAEVTMWKEGLRVGSIVQRVGNTLLTIGEGEKGVCHYYFYTDRRKETVRGRVLESGERIEVVEN